MNSLRSALLSALGLIILCGAFIHLSSRTPAPAPASAPPTAFSAVRAMAHVQEIAQRPHPIGSADHARVRAYVVAELAKLGLEPQIQQTTGLGTRNAVAAWVQNVLVRLPGRNPGGPAVLLVSHYDGVPSGPAAGDDAAAVAAVLETLRALRSAPPLAHDVIALFTDGEEVGLAGAAAFTREHPWAKDAAVILNVEGRGTAGPSQAFETGPGNLDVVRVLRSVPGAEGTSLAVTVYRALPNDTDLSELAPLGQPALNFSVIDGFERYHTAQDDVRWLEAGSVQHHGANALALTRAFADGPLPRPRTGDAVFFTIPGLGMVAYPAELAMPVAIIAALLVVVACLAVRRRDPRWVRNAILGVIGTAIATALGAAAAFGAGIAIQRALPVAASGLWFGSRGLYAAAIALLALAIAAACWALVRRWATAPGAHAGALVAWTAAMAVVSLKLPGASYLLVWPLIGATVAAIASLVSDGRRVSGAAAWVATLVVLAIVTAPVYTIAVVVFGMVGPGPAILGFFVAWSAWLLAPQLEALAAGRRWVTPLVTFALAASVLAAGLATARPSPAHPEPSAIAYVVDADSSRAWIAASIEYARPGSWGAAALGSSALVVGPATPATPDAPEWLIRGIGGGSGAMAPAPLVAAGAPEVTLVTDQMTADARRVDLRVTPAPGTYVIRLRVVETRVLSASVDGRDVDRSRYRSSPPQWTLGFVAPPAEGFTLTLTVPRNRPIELDVVARHLGLPDAVRAKMPPRPDGVVPIHGGDQTLVHRRVRFSGLAADGPNRIPNELPVAAVAALVSSLAASGAHASHVWRDTPPQNADGTVNGYIEIPKGEKRKWEFDIAGNERAVDRVMPDDLGGYPVNYGFVPQTISYDGDPFDILVLGPPIDGGRVVRGAVVGLMFMDDEKGHDAKVVVSLVGNDGQPLHALTERDQAEIAEYFRRYKRHEPGKFSRVPGWGSAADGLAFVKTTHAFFRECRTPANSPCVVSLGRRASPPRTPRRAP